MCKHNTITLFAGGIPATPFMPMITSFTSALLKQEDQRVTEKNKISMHFYWTCRDYGLVDYMTCNFLGPTWKNNDIINSDYLSLKKLKHHATKNDSNDDGTKKLKHFFITLK